MWNVYAYPNAIVGWQLIGVINIPVNPTDPDANVRAVEEARRIYHALRSVEVQVQRVKVEAVQTPPFGIWPAVT